MSAQENVETVKKFFAALSGGDTQDLLAVAAGDIEWILPGKDWPLAGTYRGHAGLADLLQKSEQLETSTEPREFIAQGDRVLVVGFASGRIIATGKTFKDDWVFAITVQDGQVKSIREYIDTQALAEASGIAADSTGNEEIIKQLYVAGEPPGLDPGKFVSFFSEEGYMWDLASGTKFRGKAIGDSIAALASAFSDVRREISSIYVTGDVVIVEHRIRGTHDGELAVGSRTVAPTGKAIDVPCADVFRLVNGKIVAFNCYSLSSVMQQQLGLTGS
ncbi:MAG: ketosteroid isomerase [Akkermansiaceae bacterium]|nr:ketosteroid isomerase [Akkermansiaceae bacterium]